MLFILNCNLLYSGFSYTLAAAEKTPHAKSYRSQVSTSPLLLLCKEGNIEGQIEGQIEENDKTFSVSTPLGNCLELTNGHLQDLSSQGEVKPFEWVKAAMAFTKCSSYCNKVSEYFKKDTLSAEEFNSANDNTRQITECVEKQIPRFYECASAAYLIDIHGRSWKDPEHLKSSEGKSSSSSPAVITASQSAMNVSSNESLSCASKGVETLDYQPCKDFSDYASALEVAHSAVKTGQTLYYQNKALDASLEASKNAANDATAGLKVQKSSFKDMQETATQNSALEASKAAILWSKYKKMQDVEVGVVMEKCDSINLNSVKEKVAEYKLDDKVTSPADICKNIVKNPAKGYAFFMNEDKKNAMKQQMFALGVKSVAEGATAYMAGQRVDQLNDAIANVNNFKPTTSPGLEQAVEASFCQMNPTAAKCRNNLNSQFSTIGDNIVDFDGNGAGVVYNGDPNTDSSSGGNGTNSNSANSNGKKTSTIGSAITNANNGSGLAETGSAASISKGQGPAPTGGGGGGGAAGGGSGPGGLPNTNQAQAGTSSAVTGKAPSYHGGGFSMMGGLGIKSAKKTADSGNPLSGLFNKNKEGGDKVVNFRGPASTNVGNKSDNLFNMISNRYSSVNTDKRLLEYEEGPGK